MLQRTFPMLSALAALSLGLLVGTSASLAQEPCLDYGPGGGGPIYADRLPGGDGLHGRRPVYCQEYGDSQYNPDLFYNYYAPATACGGVPAQMYVSPLPTPPLVGHTWITYQPLMPQEFLYHHHRVYHRYYDNGRGLARTRVSWEGNPIKSLGATLLYPMRFAR